MTRWPAATAAMLLAFTTAVHATSDYDLFMLCPAQEGMRLLIEEVSPDTADGGLATEQIRNLAEVRLRAATVFDPTAEPFLYLGVGAGDRVEGTNHFPFYSIAVEYTRGLVDLDTSMAGWGSTWSKTSTGQGDSPFVLSHLSEMLDSFLVKYLRVRDSAECQELRAKAAG